jgi:ferritin-like metal-binding protein YciE
MTQTEQLISWLNSAHAMEQSMAKVLENHAKDAKEVPEMHARITEHVEETRGHARRVEECLAILGEKPSGVKSAMGSAMGMVQGAASSMFHDEIVKNVLADYSAEHFEIACYTSLAYAAEEAGQPRIVEICHEILDEEENMASWLEEQIEESTRMVLQQTSAA